VPADPTVVAGQFRAHGTAFGWGFAFGLVSIACYVAVTVLFYRLFRPVSPTRAILATCFGLVGLTIQAVGGLGQLAPAILLGGQKYLNVFTAGQLRALALTFLDLGHRIDGIGLVFDGLFLLLTGELIIRSTVLPRLLGVLVTLAGLGWLTFLAPALTARALPFVEILGVVAEAALMLWLLVVGVDRPRPTT
jgi:hypothetical protein